jgi:hypothetical protein
MAFYELRQYQIRSGKMAEWIAFMEDEVIPLQVSKGMVITGCFRGETDDSVFVWMRRFESEAERERQYAAVYDTDRWRTHMHHRAADLVVLETIAVQRIVPIRMSPAQ